MMARMTQICCIAGILLCADATCAKTVRQSAREIPVAADVDVVVVGGTVGAVAAAVEAARARCKGLSDRAQELSRRGSVRDATTLAGGSRDCRREVDESDLR